MQRQLASIQRVREILPIENADAIELARIHGWQCVVKKGEFQVGDLGAYFEIDAVPPDAEPFRFLWKHEDPRPAKYRIRTMRLRGALSQGLLLPLAAVGIADGVEGEDLTERLGVGKYEPPQTFGNGVCRGPFPAFVPKTDEMRVQSVPDVLDELRGKPYVATLKLDGTSATYVIDPRDDSFHACSRNQSVAEGANVYWEIARRHAIEATLRRTPHLALQGEIVGPGIQKNPLGLRQVAFYAFSLYDRERDAFLSDAELRAFCESAELPVVPIVEQGDAFDETLESLLAKAEGKYPDTDREREGIVIRPRTETFSPTLGGRLSFKAISNRFLLAEKD